MNKDITVCTFFITTSEYGMSCNVIKIFRKDLMPHDLRNIQEWVKSRYIILNRCGIRSFLKQIDVTRLEDFVSITNCVSLKDTYWVKGENSRKLWKSVSPYGNPLNKVIADYSFDREISGKFITGSPDFATDGTFPKCWKRVNGVLQLYKAGSSGACDAGNEPYSEVYASMVSDMLGICHVKYTLGTYRDRVVSKCDCSSSGACDAGNEPYSEVYASMVSDMLGICHVKYTLGTYRDRVVSKCDCMCSEDIGFISYRDYTGDRSEDFSSLLRKFSKFRYDYRLVDMLLLDYLLCNVNRHYGNFGFLVNNDTNKIVGLSPTFNNNLSCIPYYMADERLEYYIDNIRAKDGRTWNELFNLINSKYVRSRLSMFASKYKKIRIIKDRDDIVDRLIRVQLKRTGL